MSKMIDLAKHIEDTKAGTAMAKALVEEISNSVEEVKRVGKGTSSRYTIKHGGITQTYHFQKSWNGKNAKKRRVDAADAILVVIEPVPEDGRLPPQAITAEDFKKRVLQ